MNNFFYSGGDLTPKPRTPERHIDRTKFKPAMRVIRKATGMECSINAADFHEALYEEAFPKPEDRMLTVTTPQGTSTVEMTHGYLERLSDEALRGLNIAKYVTGGNCMDRRGLTRGILQLLGHTEDIVRTMTVADKEKILMQEWEARVEAEKAARVAAIEEAKQVAVEAVRKSKPKAAPKAAPKQESKSED
jgi:hypothetical protein